MGTLLECIESIPNYLKNIISNYDEYDSKLKGFKGIKKIVIVGSGSSYNTAELTKYYAQLKAGILVETYYPSIFLDYTPDYALSENAIYVFISQGGETNLVNESLLRVKKLGYKTISITEKLSTTIAKNADIALEMGSVDEPYIFRTLGYSCTVTVLYLMYIILGDLNKDKEISQLEKSVSLIINSIEDGKEFSKQNSNILVQRNFIFSGSGAMWPLAEEANIKLMEMVPKQSNCFELEELIHGPQNMFNCSQVFFIITDNQKEFEKANKIKKFIEEVPKAKVYLVGRSKENDIVINAAEEFSGLVYISFFQVISYYLAKQNNRDLSTTMYPEITKYIRKTI